MQAITTKILPATNHRPTRVKAMAKCGSVTLSTDQFESTDEAHKEAAKALCVKMNWQGYLVQGIDHKEDNVFVFVPHIASEVQWQAILTVGDPVRGAKPSKSTSTMSPGQFVRYLRSTLIPDLKTSGSLYTAEDFGLISQLLLVR